jgi:hypothetical protein
MKTYQDWCAWHDDYERHMASRSGVLYFNSLRRHWRILKFQKDFNTFSHWCREKEAAEGHGRVPSAEKTIKPVQGDADA